MIHIVFNTADIAALEQAIELDESLSGKIIEIKDDYAVGPLSDIYETEGYQARRDWWKDVLAHSPYEDQLNIVDDKLTVHQLINALTHDENEMIWIWMGLGRETMTTGLLWQKNSTNNLRSVKMATIEAIIRTTCSIHIQTPTAHRGLFQVEKC